MSSTEISHRKDHREYKALTFENVWQLKTLKACGISRIALLQDNISMVTGEIINALHSPGSSPPENWKQNKHYIVGPKNIFRNEQIVVVPVSGLPEGWEQKQTAEGRTYYINHTSKKTQWTGYLSLCPRIYIYIYIYIDHANYFYVY